MAKLNNPNQNVLYNSSSLNRGPYSNAPYPQQVVNYPKQPFGTPQILPTNFKPNNLYGLEVNQFRNFVPNQQPLPQLNYPMLNNNTSLNQQILNPVFMQNFPQINPMRSSFPSQMDRFGVNVSYYQDQATHQLPQSLEPGLADVKTEAKLEYSDI